MSGFFFLIIAPEYKEIGADDAVASALVIWGITCVKYGRIVVAALHLMAGCRLAVVNSSVEVYTGLVVQPGAEVPPADLVLRQMLMQQRSEALMKKEAFYAAWRSWRSAEGRLQWACARRFSHHGRAGAASRFVSRADQPSYRRGI